MPMTPEAALILTRKLAKQLADDRDKIDMLERYYCGDQPLSFATAKFREAFGGLFKAAAVNWMPLVVSAVLERLHVEGFRSPDGKGTDSAMWDDWQNNYLDLDSQIVHTEALKYGRGYVTVGQGDEPDSPLITIECTRDVTHLMSPVNRRKRAAALRVFTDDDDLLCSTLYTPELTWRWQRRKGSATALGIAGWEPRRIDGRDWPEVNVLGVVPVVPLLSRPDVDGWGASELNEVIPIQDMINKTVADMLVASEFTALPQRWAAGLDIIIDPVTKQPRDPFPLITRLMQAEDKDTKFGQFMAADLQNYVRVLESFKQDVATLSRTPPHYFYLSGQFPSGESIKSAETGLVAKSKDRMISFGEPWEEVMRISAAVRTKDRSILDRRNNYTVWRDPEYRTEGEHVDATLKKQALGVSWRQLMEDLNYSPQQIELMMAERDAEQAKAAAAQAVMFGTAVVPGTTTAAGAPIAAGAKGVPVGEAIANGDQVVPAAGSALSRQDAKYPPPASI